MKIMKRTRFFGMMLFALALATTACSNVNDPNPEPDPVAGLPFSETFETSIGKFTTQSVTGAQVWAFNSNKYVTVSGHLSADSTNHANEDWLISPEIDLSSTGTAKLTFDHVARYFADPKTEATIWVSSNYVDGLPATATWIQLPTKTFTDPGSWPTVLPTSGEISLTAYAGKKIKIAFKYLSTDTKAGTWELKNFLVQEGEATVDPTDVVTGNGTEATPYNVAGGIANQGGLKWVKGYIVGYVWSGTATSYTFTTDTCTQATNILIAGSKTETDPTKCIAVQLPTGAVRTGLSLVTTKANLGKEVTLYGSLELYFGKPGLKTVSYYVLEGGTTGGTKPVDTSNAIFTETFGASLGAFTTNSVVGAEVWAWKSGYGAVMSGFVTVSSANEDWLISPTVNLTGKTAATLSFDHTINKGLLANMQTNHTLWLSADNGITWEQMAITTYPAGTTWTFVNTGNIVIPSKYLGVSTFKFAFKYLCSSTESASWEIKNVLIK